MRVNGFLAGASPIAFNEPEVAEFLRAGKLAQNPVLFAYDIIWEPGNWMFNADGRKRWDRDWEAWIVERYGDLASAEADWGMAVPRAGGGVVAPSDRQLAEDGPWRVMVAAYRRFMDDLMSRKWNDAVRRLRALDPNHLISFRQGNTLPHDFALTATSKHIDFICPEGYSIPQGEDGYNAAGFLTRYVDFTTRGKPIYWAEFGRSVWDGTRMRPDASGFAGQAAYHELFYRLVLDAGATATAPWWWPGGYRVDEKSDFGIINPDGTPRPAAEMITRYRPRLQAPRGPSQPGAWFTFDRDAHAGGYWWAAFHEGAEAYARRMRPESCWACARRALAPTRRRLRFWRSAIAPTTAITRPSTSTPSSTSCRYSRGTATGRTCVTEQPSRCLPTLRSEVRASVGNIQEAIWLTSARSGDTPGAVYLSAAPGSSLSFRQPIAADTPYLADADMGEFALPPVVNGQARVVFQMTAAGRAWFGEKRTLTFVTH